MSLWLSDPFGDITTANQQATKQCAFPNPNPICDTINGAPPATARSLAARCSNVPRFVWLWFWFPASSTPLGQHTQPSGKGQLHRTLALPLPSLAD